MPFQAKLINNKMSVLIIARATDTLNTPAKINGTVIVYMLTVICSIIPEILE